MAWEFQGHDIAGYQGKEIELWIKRSVATAPNQADQTAYQIRGVQSFSPSEEKAESKVSELGFDTTKTIYGTASYSASVNMLIRDLVNIARVAGVDPTNTGRLVVTEFLPVNCSLWIKDPDTETIWATLYVGGFRARTSSKALAVEANATVTLDGSADMIALVDGKAVVREHQGDGSCTLFAVEAGVNPGDIYLVEYPSGKVLTTWNGYTFVASGIGAVPSISFTTAPTNGYKVKIVYKSQS
jgi:hypothetical protein